MRDLLAHIPLGHAERHAWMADVLGKSIAGQIRALRKSRKMTQEQFGALVGMQASRISQLETPEHAIRCNVTTLLRIAKACDVALIIKFVDWRTFALTMLVIGPNGIEIRPAIAPATFAESFAAVLA